MKKATYKQITAIAEKYEAIGTQDGHILYAHTFDGRKVQFGLSVYRDAFHHLTKEGVLKYNDSNRTYSKA